MNPEIWTGTVQWSCRGCVEKIRPAALSRVEAGGWMTTDRSRIHRPGRTRAGKVSSSTMRASPEKTQFVGSGAWYAANIEAGSLEEQKKEGFETCKLPKLEQELADRVNAQEAEHE